MEEVRTYLEEQENVTSSSPNETTTITTTNSNLNEIKNNNETTSLTNNESILISSISDSPATSIVAIPAIASSTSTSTPTPTSPSKESIKPHEPNSIPVSSSISTATSSSLSSSSIPIGMIDSVISGISKEVSVPIVQKEKETEGDVLRLNILGGAEIVSSSLNNSLNSSTISEGVESTSKSSEVEKISDAGNSKEKELVELEGGATSSKPSVISPIKVSRLPPSSMTSIKSTSPSPLSSISKSIQISKSIIPSPSIPLSSISTALPLSTSPSVSRVPTSAAVTPTIIPIKKFSRPVAADFLNGTPPPSTSTSSTSSTTSIPLSSLSSPLASLAIPSAIAVEDISTMIIGTSNSNGTQSNSVDSLSKNEKVKIVELEEEVMDMEIETDPESDKSQQEKKEIEALKESIEKSKKLEKEEEEAMKKEIELLKKQVSEADMMQKEKEIPVAVPSPPSVVNGNLIPRRVVTMKLPKSFSFADKSMPSVPKVATISTVPAVSTSSSNTSPDPLSAAASLSKSVSRLPPSTTSKLSTPTTSRLPPSKPTNGNSRLPPSAISANSPSTPSVIPVPTSRLPGSSIVTQNGSTITPKLVSRLPGASRLAPPPQAAPSAPVASVDPFDSVAATTAAPVKQSRLPPSRPSVSTSITPVVSTPNSNSIQLPGAKSDSLPSNLIVSSSSISALLDKFPISSPVLTASPTSITPNGSISTTFGKNAGTTTPAASIPPTSATGYKGNKKVNSPFSAGGSHYNLPDSVRESYASLANRTPAERDQVEFTSVNNSAGVGGDKFIAPSPRSSLSRPMDSTTSNPQYNNNNNATSSFGSNQFTPSASSPVPTPSGTGAGNSIPYPNQYPNQSRGIMGSPLPQHLLNSQQQQQQYYYQQQQQQMLSKSQLHNYNQYTSNNRPASQLQYEQQQYQSNLQLQQQQRQLQQYQQQQAFLLQRQQFEASRIRAATASGTNQLIPLGGSGSSSANQISRNGNNQTSQVPIDTRKKFVHLDPSPEAIESPISPPSVNASRLGESGRPPTIPTTKSHSRDSSPESAVPLIMRKDIERRLSSSSSSQASTSTPVVQKFSTATIDYPLPQDKTFYPNLLSFHIAITQESLKNSGYTYHFNNSYATRVALVCTRLNEVNCRARFAVKLESKSDGGWILDDSYTVKEHNHGVHPQWEKNHNWKPDARGPIKMADREIAERARMRQNKGTTVKRTVNLPGDNNRDIVASSSRAVVASSSRPSTSGDSGITTDDSLHMPQVGDLYPIRHSMTIAASYAAHQLGYSFVVTRSPGNNGIFQLGCRRSCAPTPLDERCSAEMTGVKQPDGQWEVTSYKFTHNHKKELRKKWKPPLIPKEEANLVTAKDVSKYRTVSQLRPQQDESSEAEESGDDEDDDESEASGNNSGSESGSEVGSEVGSDNATSNAPEEDNRRKKRRQRQINGSSTMPTRSSIDSTNKKPKRSISPSRRSSTSQPKRALSPSLEQSTSKRRTSLVATPPPPPAFTLPPLPSDYDPTPNHFLSVDHICSFLHQLNPKFVQWSTNFAENGITDTYTLTDLIMAADEFLGHYLVEIGIPSLPRILITNKFREIRNVIDQ